VHARHRRRRAGYRVDLGDSARPAARRLFELSARYEALGGTAKGSEMGEFDCVQTFRAVLMRVDGINTFGVSAGHFASFGVVSRGQLTVSIPGSSTENMLVKA
jgi:hypothetical protein